MHIKQVVLSGFRSFRHQSEIEPFSARHNVIIGRNGSGKSNFFAAIQFVLLSQKFMHLRQEERQQLLHEGAGANVMTAFVEVIFDNSDGRMTVEGDEVVLRRTIGVKKDEFFLNRKRVTKQEVSSLLESAGFSRSNPYYIVQQGKVNMLTLMRDDQRLDLLKEVAGTKVYEERRAESLQIIQETDHKREKIQEVVSYIEERLGELDEEKEELRAYQRLDKDRRALEYTLYDTELKGARADLNKAEEARLREIERADDLHRRLHDSRDALQEVEERMEALRLGLEKKSGERGRVEGEREELLAQREGAANEEKTLWDRVEGEEAKQEDLRAQLVEAEKEIDTVREQLRSTIEPEYNAAKKAVDDLKRELKEKEAIRAELHDKQGRRAAFRSVAERDAHLKKQQAQVGAAVQEREGLIRKNQAEREKALRQVEQEKGQVARREKELGQKEEALAALGQSRSEMVGTRNRNQDIRKQKQEKIAELEERKSRLEDNIRKAEQTLRFAMPKHIALGLETVARLAEEERISGYYGPVYSLLELKDPKFRQAVEVAAGNSLFNVVVDTDETAAKLMKRLEEERGGGGGRVCFMPLNRLRVKPVSSYPDSADVVPLLSAALTYPRHVDKAMRQIFGLKLLARDLEVAARFSETAGMDAITLDGDEASRKGSMQGGYHDERNSKFAQVLAIRAAKAELRPVTEALQEEEKAHQELDTAMSRLLAEMQKKEVKRRATREHEELVWGSRPANDTSFVNVCDFEVHLLVLSFFFLSSAMRAGSKMRSIPCPVKCVQGSNVSRCSWRTLPKSRSPYLWRNNPWRICVVSSKYGLANWEPHWTPSSLLPILALCVRSRFVFPSLRRSLKWPRKHFKPRPRRDRA
jgi:structural maintenance of chromosome 3 (chondroitin sulfate proteoglycan 6)